MFTEHEQLAFADEKRLADEPIPPSTAQHRAVALARTATPYLIWVGLAAAAHAQGTVDFSGANTVMGTFKTFALYAGAIIAFGCLIWAGIKLMGGRFQDAIPQLFGALFGAGVLGWGAGWIGSLTGQSLP